MRRLPGIENRETADCGGWRQPPGWRGEPMKSSGAEDRRVYGRILGR